MKNKTQKEKKMDNEYRWMLDYFEYKHLPEHLQTVSKPFGDLANKIAHEHNPQPEVTVCLRKLLEAKDCAVRAALNTKAPRPCKDDL